MLPHDLIALAERIVEDLADMSDDELRVVARRMVAPFMHELAIRGQSYTLSSDEFTTPRGQGSSLN